MADSRAILHYSPNGSRIPAAVERFAAEEGFEVQAVSSGSELLVRVSRAYPAAVTLDGAEPADEAFEICRALKDDAFTAVVPVIVHVPDGAASGAEALEAGADEVLSPAFAERESALRIRLALRRADRDVSVHPTTRLPGTVRIERDFAERLRSGEKFAVCYADLDHFKEFNDRYGYNHGDRVILIVSRILRDIVRAHSPRGFVGHIGGDDFIFSVPLEDMKACCEDVITVFDEIIPLQYPPEDRERGWFSGKDRQGHTFRVPLMTVSIGVVTNGKRELTHTAEISELATEMKTYAKSFEGSIYLVDRRSGKSETTVPAI